jgi:hypothetical protein
VRLPLNTPVKLDVLVDPQTSGAHSALLYLDNPLTVGIDLQVMNTVFAPTEFSAATGFKIDASGEIARNQASSLFVRVPQGASALKIDMDAGGPAGKGQVRFLRYAPTGVPIDVTSSTNCYNPAAGAGCAGGSPTSRTVTNPQPGVWEIIVEARRTSDVDVAPWSLSAAVLGATITPNPDEIAAATIGTPVARGYTVGNTLGAFTGRVVGSTLGSASIQTPTIADLTQQRYPVTVTPGSTSFTATIGGTSDPGADLDLVVYNCTTGTCRVAGSSAGSTSEESVTITNPAAGQWLVLVDGYSVPAGTTTYNYLDTFVNPAFGTVAVTDANAAHASGSSWTVPGTVTANAAPAAGRVLRGQLSVLTDANAQVGSGTVVVRSVS